MRAGHVFWLFGLSGAGKTTLAAGLDRWLAAQGCHARLMLDGDVLRTGLCRDLGFTDEARTENIRRAAEVARLAVRQGQVVVAAFITPREDLRAMVVDIIGREQVELIWVDAPLAVCRQRDPKGLYRRSDAGAVPLFTGVQSAFEPPARCDLHLPTATGTPEELGRILRVHCQARLNS